MPTPDEEFLKRCFEDHPPHTPVGVIAIFVLRRKIGNFEWYAVYALDAHYFDMYNITQAVAKIVGYTDTLQAIEHGFMIRKSDKQNEHEMARLLSNALFNHGAKFTIRYID